MAWWNSLSGLEQSLFVISVSSTVLLVAQIILLLLGFSHDGDIDVTDIDGGVSLFTLKGLTAFFSIGGWSGMVAASGNAKDWAVILIALGAGLSAFFIIYLMMRQINKLQYSGNLDYNRTVGKAASVYVSIPPSMSGKGKITLTLQERYTEIDAMTREKKKIPTDTIVEILEVSGDTVIVKTFEQNK